MTHLKTTGSRAAAQKYAEFSPFRVRSITLVAAPGTPGETVD